jgi:CheY-like chemotaxis protein
MARPTFVLVVEDGSRLEALRRDLSRRYEADYQVIAVASAAAALGTLRDLADSGVEVALVFADERMAGMGGPAFSGQLNLRYFMLRAAGSGIR